MDNNGFETVHLYGESGTSDAGGWSMVHLYEDDIDDEDVICHEWGHTVDSRALGGFGNDATLYEGWANFIGVMVNHVNAPDPTRNDTLYSNYNDRTGNEAWSYDLADDTNTDDENNYYCSHRSGGVMWDLWDGGFENELWDAMEDATIFGINNDTDRDANWYGSEFPDPPGFPEDDPNCLFNLLIIAGVPANTVSNLFANHDFATA